MKTPRRESRDADRRSPLNSIYRMPPSSNDSHVDHPVAAENRAEPRDSKDVRDLRFENRDMKMEKNGLHGESRRESQNAKGEKEIHVEGRGDDN